MNVYLLGAGASKAYDQSKSGLRMPLAKEVFKTFDQLEISANPWVLTGNILSYIKEKKSVKFVNAFRENYDIEEFHSEVEEELFYHLATAKKTGELTPEAIIINGVYTQLIFFFCSVINEIQNGPISKAHSNLVSQASKNDRFITFNWDTLLDRSMTEVGGFSVESDYGFTPLEVFRDGWNSVTQRGFGEAKIIKLHGSTNWITSYPGIDHDSKELNLMQRASYDTVRIFEFSTKPYYCYQGRYMAGYEPFSLGYYPPNILNDIGMRAKPEHLIGRFKPKFPWMSEGITEEKGIPSSPLIIPPVKNKGYSFYGELFKHLWESATDVLSKANKIYVIGYSFPRTDLKSISLFKDAFFKRCSIPEVVVINPFPEEIVSIFNLDFGIPMANIEVRKVYFKEDFKP